MFDVAFVIASQPHELDQLVSATRAELERQGMATSLHETFPEADPTRLFILVSPREFVAVRGADALPSAALLARTIFLGAEAPASIEAGRDLYLKAGRVFDISQEAVTSFHHAGIGARLLRPGYCPEWDRFDSDAERSTDAMFLGAHSLRRTGHLSDASGVLSRWNSEVRIIDPQLVGVDSRLNLLAQSKLVINLHRDRRRQIEWLPMLEAMHAGAVVVSEHSTGLAPFEPSSDLILASPESLPWVIDGLLRDEDRLTSLRNQAYRRLRDWLPFAATVAVLRTALLELLGRPLQDAPASQRLVTRAAGGSERIDRGPSAEESLRDELADLRQEVQRLEDAVRVGVDEARPTGSCASPVPNAAWATAHPPRLSVLVPGNRGASRWDRTLDSLVTNAMRDFEIVAVTNRGAAEAGRMHVWLEAHHEIPSISAQVDETGDGPAFNAARGLARAPACLLIDPGQILYPRCLEVLVAALDANPDVVFVYAIQAVRGAAESYLSAGGDHLRGFREWDPGSLHEPGDVGTPVLIHTDRLRELDGIVQDPLLSGDARHALWCRVAERGWSGRLVPQILSRQTVGEAEPPLASRRPALGGGAVFRSEPGATVRPGRP